MSRADFVTRTCAVEANVRGQMKRCILMAGHSTHLFPGDDEGTVATADDTREKFAHDEPSPVQAIIEVLSYLDGSGPIEWDWVYDHLEAGLREASDGDIVALLAGDNE